MPYEAPGYCIYCGKDNVPLTEEHIIPRSFGGTLKFPDASCRDCAGVIGPLEDHTEKRLLWTLRPHLGVLSHSRKPLTPKIGARKPDGTFYSFRVPLDRHPGIAFMPSYKPPWKLYGLTGMGGVEAKVNIIHVVDNVAERLKFYPEGIELFPRDYAMETFARVLGKIAHAYAMAEFGKTFKPFLLDLFFGKEQNSADFVGGENPDPSRPIGTEKHEIEIVRHPADEAGNLVVVRIRLFANILSPTYFVVAGERNLLSEQIADRKAVNVTSRLI